MAEASSSTSGDDVKFVEVVPDMYECPICMSVMKVPVQTECGHRFCKQCIEKSLENKSVCPLDNLYMDRSNIFVDKFAAREINAFEVQCTIPHCTWTGPYGQLENHKKDCDYLIVTCPNKCSETSLKKFDVEDHLLNACKKRIVTCNYCRLKVVFKTLKKHEETCDYYPTECPNECGRKIPFKDLRKHYEEECSKSEGTACSYKKIGCIFQGSDEELREHMAGSTLEHMQLMAERITMLEEQRPPACNAVASTCMERSSPSEAVCNDSKESSTTVSELEEMFQVHEQSLEKLGQLSETNRTHQTNLGQQMMSIKQNVENSLKQLKDVLQKQNDFQLELNARMWAGQKFYWRIKNFKDTFKKAKDGHQPALHSTPFYTGIPGYRMCLRINMNGIDSGARSHVSVFVHLMKGEYDSILSWPFLGQIKLSICDQTNRNPCDVIEQLNASRSLQAFEKPQQARNPKGYGYVEMMRHELLNTRNYTRDDTLLLKAEVFLNSTL